MSIIYGEYVSISVLIIIMYNILGKYTQKIHNMYVIYWEYVNISALFIITYYILCKLILYIIHWENK